MALTRNFKQTVMARAVKDIKFRRGLLIEAVNEFLEGDVAVGKKLLRDYINATITFQQLAKELNKSSKSIHRMLGPNGNPRLDCIFGIIKVLQMHEHVTLRAKIQNAAYRRAV